MNTIDFSQLGGFPMTQDTLAYLQAANKEVLAAWFADVPVGQPVILSGMQMSSGGGGVSVSPGFFYLDGEVYKSPAMSAGFTMVGQNYVVNITQSTTSVTFQNLAVHPVYITKSASLGIITGTTTVGDQYLWDSFKLAHEYLRYRALLPYTTINVNASPVTGVVNYRRNILTNQLHVYGWLTHSNAQIINTANYYATMGATFTVGNRPSVAVQFKGLVRYHNSSIAYSNSAAVLQGINMELATSGVLTAGWIKPDVGTTGYTVTFNEIIQI